MGMCNLEGIGEMTSRKIRANRVQGMDRISTSLEFEGLLRGIGPALSEHASKSLTDSLESGWN